MDIDFRKLFGKTKEFPDGIWTKCTGCGCILYRKAVEQKFFTCPECNFHFPITPEERIKLLLDENSFEEIFMTIESVDPLNFNTAGLNYKEKILENQKTTGMKDAVITGTGTIFSKKVAIAITDSRFLMGSMGSVVGEKVVRITELAQREKIPLVIISGSGGGARMYEGCISLMQMAKTVAAIKKFQDNGGLYISVLTHPTMAGVLASFAGIGDIIIAEPKALIGFTGPRVIAQTIKQELPDGFQTSEFLLQHGFIDMIVERPNLKNTIGQLLDYLT
ncbi:MAG: acetyl-CoA carboxylase, carboxyltransferase subunit beta [Planctomycetota bacterium]